MRLAECRINFLHEFISSVATGLPDLPHRDWVRLFANSVEKAKKAATPDRPFWGAKVIYTTIRFILPGNSSVPDSNGYYRLRWYMEDCIKLKLEFPDLIAGMLSRHPLAVTGCLTKKTPTLHRI